ncbi:MAG TPA: hypothetical protein VMZ31_17115 [Phycisphaerae bacterium]|nr:hypothetical protein [Phycisphaerae bacterium]
MERVATVVAACAAVSILAAWPGAADAARTVDQVSINDDPWQTIICPGERIQVQVVVSLTGEDEWGSTAYKVGDGDWVCHNHDNYDSGDTQPVDFWFEFWTDQTGPLDLVIRAYPAEEFDEPSCDDNEPFTEVVIPAAIVVLDADGDGVCDPNDLCPDTPECAVVDPNGCPIDSDGDGVANGCDQCPDTPECAVVDPNGCPIDSDGDGLPNGCDQCPGTPDCADPVDPNGCPTDSDGDGVVDGCDDCPGTPGCADPVDANGCPSDSDGDGVVDGCDQCPQTAADDPVDADGCSTADDDGDGVTNDDDECPDTPTCATAVDDDGCGIDANGDDVIDGCEPPPQEIPDELRCCCGETGSVSVLGLAVGLLLMARFGGYRRHG